MYVTITCDPKYIVKPVWQLCLKTSLNSNSNGSNQENPKRFASVAADTS
jgi:hypothetical protein